MGDVPGKPELRQIEGPTGVSTVEARHPAADTYYLYAEGADELIFTENETNTEELYGLAKSTPYVKDAFHRFVVNGETTAVNPEQQPGSRIPLVPGSRSP
jgi:hypothetical protein